MKFACNYPNLRPVQLRHFGCIKSSDPKNSLSACLENSEHEKYDNIFQSVLTKDCFKQSCLLLVDTMLQAEFERGRKHPKVISLRNTRNFLYILRLQPRDQSFWLPVPAPCWMTSKGPRWRREKAERRYFQNITRNWKVPRKRDTRRKFIYVVSTHTL